ncbi:MULTISPECIES: NAD(P)/FAD-dependent oxidoreductase [Terrisporobacter]|uniref:FAD-dependent oxidoreductase n=1 Tax=Terrisporobacter muris TaxID=2963284 RepID=A0A9X2S244_9FIRM|nr:MULTISPECIES: FAD-dependent oxidoreductase [Terrisporobacter]MCR1823499.1 FAD-dependent oxidoreductase [Terrisporobacter muris]MDY3373164.1 FAD-dependent oxidoreductase [Terrisporobacter othiniensis]
MLDKLLNKLSSKKEKKCVEINNNPTKYLILGASAAGINAAKVLRKLDPKGSIIVVSKDDKIYSRCMLHHVISEHRTVDGINFVDIDFMEKNNITWKKYESVQNINTDKKIVKLEKEDISYDKLLIATGASAFIPPIKNIKEGKHIYPLRNIEDVIDIKEKIKTTKKVAVIGAGLIGIDVLTSLLDMGNIEVSLIYPNEFILDRQLDKYSSKVYEDKFIELGAKLYPSRPVNQIILDKSQNVKGIELGDKTVVECDMIIVSTGVKPNTEFVANTKIEDSRGIVINDKCETTVKDVYAAGDVVGKNAIWPLAVKQGIVAAYNMVGVEKILDDEFTFKNSMNFVGIPTISLGIAIPPDDTYEVITRCDKEGYKKFVIKDDVITGFIAQGDISYTGPITYLIKHKIQIPNLRERVFDIGYADFFSMKENGEFEYNINI